MPGGVTAGTGTRRLVVEADGGSRGNPGPAGYGALVRDAATGAVLREVGEAIGTATNNVAEYRGLLAGLRAAADIDPNAAVEVRMDSKLVVEQMSGRWKIKHEDMVALARQASRVIPPQQVSYRWVPRERNGAADALANAAMDGRPVGGVPAPPVGRRPAPDPAADQAGDHAGDLDPRRAWDVLAAEPDAVLVDVRSRAEWSLVGLPDLRGINKDVVTVEWTTYPDGARNPAFLDQLRGAGVGAGARPGAPLLFLCRSGVRSLAAAREATAAGLGPAWNVSDGFEGPVDAHGHREVAGWKVSGLPWRQG